jgi:hypothetical protein
MMMSGTSRRPVKPAEVDEQSRHPAGRSSGSSGDPSALALTPPPELDPPVHEAVTDLYAYVLVLDAERQRLSARADGLAQLGAEPLKKAELDERGAEITKELEALREMIAALRVGQSRGSAATG